MAQREVVIMKEVLQQHILIRKLYMEIEEERDASATAASEALAMILRLQEEKAAEKLEACQYRRLAEEKLHHVQQSLIILEEAMEDKEIEISMLNHQIQVYKRNLLNNGINDLDIENIHSHGDDINNGISDLNIENLYQHGDIHDRDTVDTSLPPLKTSRLYSEFYSNENSPWESSRQTIWKTIGGNIDQISEKDKQVSNLLKESKPEPTTSNRPSSSGQDTSSGYSSCHSKLQTDAYPDVKRIPDFPALNNLQNQNESDRNAFHVACVHDIFEVPESDKYHTTNESSKYITEESTVETKPCIDKQDMASEGTVDGQMMEYNSMIMDSTDGTWKLRAEFENIKCQLQQIDCESLMQMEGYDRKNEQLNLLSEIYKQLSAIECHLKESKSKSSPYYNSHLVAVMEATRVAIVQMETVCHKNDALVYAHLLYLAMRVVVTK
ncbi:hypothetical protein ZIOFF_039626 [Zingiber officinale]|uniref:GTD-binding domain-containing protein n=1 Tax=Zingiber officinale TaxID=94328 RepID=A0A8J5G545_ZINOF|nr:hypothetical protein ZIOFF_039626 [Zingiber officinale]